MSLEDQAVASMFISRQARGSERKERKKKRSKSRDDPEDPEKRTRSKPKERGQRKVKAT